MKDDIDASFSFTLQRHDLTEKFIKALGITSRRHTNQRIKSFAKNSDIHQAISTTEHYSIGIQHISTTEPIPVPSFISPLAYSLQKSKESSSSSHSPKDAHISRKPNRKPSFTHSENANSGGPSSFISDKFTSLEIFSKRKKAESFRHFLFPRLDCSWNKSLDDLAHISNHSHYDPELLDDEECRQIRHLSSLMAFPQNLSAHGCQSILPLQVYKSNDLKRELNNLFSHKHPEYEHFLKLSHIRSLKVKILDVALELHIDLSTVALSFVYFEKLFIKRMIVKSNRNKIAGACLLLAVKLNDSKDIRLPALLNALEKRLQIQEKEILKCEFWVFCSLEFGLVLTESEYWPHLSRLFCLLNVTEDIQEYLGLEMYNSWKHESKDGSQ